MRRSHNATCASAYALPRTALQGRPVYKCITEMSSGLNSYHSTRCHSTSTPVCIVPVNRYSFTVLCTTYFIKEALRT